MKSEKNNGLEAIVDKNQAAILAKIHYAVKIKGIKSLGIHSEFKQEGKTHFCLSLGAFLKEIYDLSVIIFNISLDGDKQIEEMTNDQVSNNGHYIDFFASVDLFLGKNLVSDISETQVNTHIFNRQLDKLTKEYDLVLVDTVSFNGKRDFSNIIIETDDNIFLSSKKSLNTNKFLVQNELISRNTDILGIVYNEIRL